MVIYQIKNKITGKLYIGQFSKCDCNEEFQKNNYWGSGKLIIRAIGKYGINSFEKRVLIKNLKTPEELDYYETLWIKKKQSKIPNGYNLTDGGERGTLGYKFTKEQLIHLSVAHKGKKSHLAGKTYDDIYGKEKADRIKSQVSSRKRGKTLEQLYGTEKAAQLKDNFINKMSGENNPFWGKQLTKEHRVKIGKNHWSKKENVDKIREKLAAHRKGKTFEEFFGKERAKEIKEKASKMLQGKVAKEYIFITPDGERIKIKGFYKFCKENGLSCCQMQKVLFGRTKTDNHKGWKVEYVK